MITFLYKNRISDAASITENSSRPYYGTAFLADNDLNSVYRGTSGNGTTTILFTFGSAISIDSIAIISNLISSGTMVLRAGTIASVGDQVFGVPLDGYGTSYKYIGNQIYKYFRLDLFGATGIGKHQCNEVFIGKRLSISEMPSYPLENSVEEDTTELTSERGQKWIYSNYERESWNFLFEGVNATTENGLYNMYKYCGKNTQPFWMALDPENNPNDIKYVRFKDNAFLSDEITKNIFDISLELESGI